MAHTPPQPLRGDGLTGTEWHDNLAIRYGMRPVGLPQQCDGCRENFSVRHALTYKKGGLVTWRHNDARDEWAWLCKLHCPIRVLAPNHIFFMVLDFELGSVEDRRVKREGTEH